MARNIYSLGLKTYFDLNVPFICEVSPQPSDTLLRIGTERMHTLSSQYVKFLVATGSDDSNIRGVFERILPEVRANGARKPSL